MLQKNQALVVVDVQVDFCTGGALAVQNTESLFLGLNEIIKEAEKHNNIIIFTKDFHHKNHSSFQKEGGKWPSHCVAFTRGAELHSELYIPNVFITVHKGCKKDVAGYSAFDGTNLEHTLNKIGIKSLLLTGIATDYCVLQTAVDAKKLGFAVAVIKDLIRAVDQSDENLSKIYKIFQDHQIEIV